MSEVIEDTRPIETLAFGALEPTPEKRAQTAAFVVDVLKSCGAVVADDIARLGCTGLAKSGFTIETSKRVRDGVGGGGVGLACYVDNDRYCLVHMGVGSLQEGQEQRHKEFVEQVSRPLTNKERGKVAAIEHIRRRTAGQDAHGAFDTIKKLAEASEEPETAGEERARAATSPWATEIARQDSERRMWTCEEHAETFWSCRFCVAAEIARGALAPSFIVINGAADMLDLKGSDATGETVAEALKSPAAEMTVYVRVARWVRKLARE